MIILHITENSYGPVRIFSFFQLRGGKQKALTLGA